MPYADPVKRAEYMHQYYQDNKVAIKKRDKEKYKNNKESINKRQKKYYVENRAACLDYSAKYKERNDKKVKEYAKLYNKAFRQNNKELLIEYNRQYSRIHKSRYKFAVRQGKKRNLIFSLTEDQYIGLITLPCNYCNNELGDTFGARTGAGLDRIDNKLGYVFDNVVSCCEKCNIIRNNILTPEETKIAVEAILLYQAKQRK